MQLGGSCHCQAVRFKVESSQPWPYMRCYCSICRKTGGAQFMINLGGDARTLHVEGREHVKVFRATVERNGERVHSQHERHFCRECGSHLWAFHPKWPDLVHPVASAIDTPLPSPPAAVHIFLDSAPAWVDVRTREGDETFEAYPDTSLADWHARHGFEDPQ